MFVTFGRLVPCGRRVASLVHFFFTCFPHKQDIVHLYMIFGPDFTYNWVISSIYSDNGNDHFYLKKQSFGPNISGQT